MAPKRKKTLHSRSILAKAMQHAARGGHAHALEHGNRVGMGRASLIAVVVAQMQLNRNVAFDGK
ncbi:Uncharacterised protein [Collinsella intestinalis]|nr:Uncharacterised protein [Collinsella intestinalis]